MLITLPDISWSGHFITYINTGIIFLGDDPYNFLKIPFNVESDESVSTSVLISLSILITVDAIFYLKSSFANIFENFSITLLVIISLPEYVSESVLTASVLILIIRPLIP